MAKLLLYFYRTPCVLIECPQYIVDDLDRYVRKFDKWLSTADHGLWVHTEFDDDGSGSVCFDGATFVDWLNQYVLTEDDEKAYFVDRNYQSNEYDKNYPHIYF